MTTRTYLKKLNGAIDCLRFEIKHDREEKKESGTANYSQIFQSDSEQASMDS